MDNLPGNPSDQNGNNGNSNYSVPPPFGSDFNPHQTPAASPSQTTIPNPPEESDYLKHEHYSEVAQHKLRDEHGHFIHSDTLTSQTSPNTPTPPNPPDSPNSPHPLASPTGGSFLPPIVEINQTGDPTYKKDPPAFGFFITNPVTYFKAFLNKLIKRQAITIKIPVLAIIVFMVGIGGFGVGFSSGMNWAFARLFPNYSPLLHRSITEQGIIQKSNTGDIILKADDKKSTIWILKSATANVNLEDYINQHVQIRGNLDATPNLIEVSEVISFNKTTP